MAIERFAIIAGSNKCGTTSLFHYLSDHPDVCPSRRKELLFFAANPSDPRESVLRRYRGEFLTGKSLATLALEASPQYLHAGKRRAENIRTYLPDAKLIFILRDPVARLVSYYRTDFGQSTRKSYGLTFKEVTELGLSHLGGKESSELSAPFAQEIAMGKYVDYLPSYAESWPPGQIKVVFFEDLIADTKSALRDISVYLGIDPHFYDAYVFEVENRTRGHRSRMLQRVGLLFNHIAEPVLIRFHGLKRRLRGAYNALNEAPINVPIEESALVILRDHYQPSVNALRAWMQGNFPGQRLPSWLTRDNGE